VQTQRPTLESAQALADLARAADAPEHLAHAAYLTLGAVAGRLGTDEERRRYLTEIDRVAEERSDDPSWRRAWIVSLGNAGLPEVFDRVGPYLLDSDESVRERAVSALRKLESPEALSALQHALTGDSSAAVRKAALEALSPRAADQAVRRSIQEATADADESIRAEALRILAGEA
jgi:HEAT repeat protein